MKPKTISDLMSREVVTVAPGTRLFDAIATMSEQGISCIVISVGNRPLGIITERDVVHLLNGDTLDETMCVEQKMTPSPITISGGCDHREAYSLFVENKVRHLIVVDGDGCIIGVLTEADFITNLDIEYFLEFRGVATVMSSRVITLGRRARLAQAVRLMAEKSISCLVVEEGRRAVGLITERDIVRFARDRDEHLATPLEEVMSQPVQFIDWSASMHDAVNVMNERKIRRLIVSGGDGEVAGIVTRSDVVKGLQTRYITFLKEMIQEKEARLNETVRRLDERVVLDNILRTSTDMAIIATDLDTCITYSNPMAEELVGRMGWEMEGLPLTELDSPRLPSAERMRESIERIETGRQLHFEFEVEGTPQVMELRLSGIWDSDQTLVGYVLMVMDISVRKREEAASKRLLEDNRRLVSKVLAIQEDERRALARELHDELGQMLGAIAMDASLLGQRCAQGGQGGEEALFAEVGEGAERINQSVLRVTESLRRVLRRLRPETLDQLGVRGAIEEVVEEWCARYREIECRFTVKGELYELDEHANITLYRVVQEALNNIAKHAQASRVSIELREEAPKGDTPRYVFLTVMDDGVGFESGAVESGFGHLGMRERVVAEGGVLELTSAPGHGTTLLLMIPVRGQTGPVEAGRGGVVQ